MVKEQKWISLLSKKFRHISQSKQSSHLSSKAFYGKNFQNMMTSAQRYSIEAIPR